MPLGFREVQPILAYVAEHPDGDVSLNALAARVGVSPFELHRAIRNVAHETPKRFSLRLRLDRAAALLLTNQTRILDVALACGFQGHETFSRAFQRRFGMLPRAYRARGAPSREHAEPHARIVAASGPCIGLYRLSLVESEVSVHYAIEQKELGLQHVLLMRKRVARPEIGATIASALGPIFAFAQQHGIAFSGHPISRYLEMGPGMVTMEVAMRIVSPVPPHVPTAADLLLDTLPAGPVACTTHVGPYDTLHNAYAALEQWIAAHGLAAAGAPWEDYVTDPTEHPDPQEWRTDVYWPVRRAQ